MKSLITYINEGLQLEGLQLGKGSRITSLTGEMFNVGDEVWYLKRFAPSRYCRALRYKPMKSVVERVKPVTIFKSDRKTVDRIEAEYKLKDVRYLIMSAVFATEEDAREYMKEKHLVEKI